MCEVKIIDDNIGVLKSGVVPLVSYCNLGTYEDGNPVYPKTVKEGVITNDTTKLKHVPFGGAMLHTKGIKEGHNKGAEGMIFPFIDPRLWYYDKSNMVENNVTTGGVLFLDIDHFDYIDGVVEHFEDYVQLLPDLMSVVYSYSGNGLHVYFITDNLTPAEYAKSVVHRFAAFYLATKKILGDKAAAQMPINSDGKKVCDPSCAAFTQREFLSHSKAVRWNEWATITNYEGEALKAIKEVLKDDRWRELQGKINKTRYFTNIQKSENPSAKTEYQSKEHKYKVLEIKEPVNPPYIDHGGRRQLFFALRTIYGVGDELWKQWERCAKLIPEEHHSTREFLKYPTDDGQGWYKEKELGFLYPDQFEVLRIYGYTVVDVADLDVPDGYNNYTTLTGDLSGYTVVDVSLKENEYMSDYLDTFISNATTYNYIASPTNTGKTEFVKNLQDKGYIADLCHPMTSTRDGKGGKNIITTKDVNENTLVEYQNTSMTFIYDTLGRIMDVCSTTTAKKRDYLFIDESHMFITEYSYRDRAISKLLGDLSQWYEHIFFMSGTTWEEYKFMKNPTIFNVTKVQPVRTALVWYNYTPEKTKEEGLKSYDQHLRQHLLNNHRKGIKSIIYTNRNTTKMAKICDKLKQYGVRIGEYNSKTKHSKSVNSVNELNTMKDYDVFIATKYMSVGVEINDKGYFDYIFTDNDINAQTIQQVKERTRKGGICITIYRDTQYEPDEMMTREDCLAFVEHLNSPVQQTRNFLRIAWKIDCGIAKYKKVLYTYDQTTDLYSFNDKAYEIYAQQYRLSREGNQKDYIFDYFSNRGINCKEHDIQVSKYTVSRKVDNQLDSDYIMEHYTELCSYVDGLGEFASMNDYIREYDTTTKMQPKFEGGFYYFNNTNFVINVINVLALFPDKAERLLQHFKENNTQINMKELNDYKMLSELLSHNDTIRPVIKHTINTMKKHTDLSLTDKKQILSIIDEELQYVQRSKKLKFDDMSEDLVSAINKLLQVIIRTTIKQCIIYPELLQSKIEVVLTYITIDDVFADLLEDKRDNTDKGVAITVDGTDYSSIKEACEELGWNYESFKTTRTRNKHKKQFTYKGHTVVVNDELSK